MFSPGFRDSIEGSPDKERDWRLFMRQLACVLCGATLVLVVLSLGGFPAARGGGAPPGAPLNGDVNCDGAVDISDAVRILEWRFLGGTAPCALAQEGFATREELGALQARVAALEAAARGFGTIATGEYTGNGAETRT